MLKDKIRGKLEAFIEGKDLFIVDLKITPQQKIMVFMDGSKNITIDQCVLVSRMLESYLEEEQLVGENYTLEVSSPGMDEPFKVKEQYIKAVDKGRLEVLKKDGIKLEGVLKKVDENHIQLEIEKKIKAKLIEIEAIDIPFKEIKTTKKLITFK